MKLLVHHVSDLLQVRVPGVLILFFLLKLPLLSSIVVSKQPMRYKRDVSSSHYTRPSNNKQFYTQLDYALFDHANLSGAHLNGANLTNADLTWANLTV